jgi:hypothetical protein
MASFFQIAIGPADLLVSQNAAPDLPAKQIGFVPQNGSGIKTGANWLRFFKSLGPANWLRFAKQRRALSSFGKPRHGSRSGR